MLLSEDILWPSSPQAGLDVTQSGDHKKSEFSWKSAYSLSCDFVNIVFLHHYDGTLQEERL